MVLFHSTWFYLTLHYSTITIRNSTWLYITLPWLQLNTHYCTMALLHLLNSTLLYHGSTSLYSTQHYSTMAVLHSICYSTMPIINSTQLYIINVPWFYFNLPDSTLFYHGSTSLYLTLHYSITALLHSTWLNITLPWLYFTLHFSTMALLRYT